MFIFQNGELYVRVGDGIVGVNYSPDGVVRVPNTKTELGRHIVLTNEEVVRKFNIKNGNSYKFPVESSVLAKQAEAEKPKPKKRRTTKKVETVKDSISEEEKEVEVADATVDETKDAAGNKRKSRRRTTDVDS